MESLFFLFVLLIFSPVDHANYNIHVHCTFSPALHKPWSGPLGTVGLPQECSPQLWVLVLEISSESRKLTGGLTKLLMILNALRTHFDEQKNSYFPSRWCETASWHLIPPLKMADELKTLTKLFIGETWSSSSRSFLGNSDQAKLTFWGLRLTFRKRRVWFGGALFKKIEVNCTGAQHFNVFSAKVNRGWKTGRGLVTVCRRSIVMNRVLSYTVLFRSICILLVIEHL